MDELVRQGYVVSAAGIPPREAWLRTGRTYKKRDVFRKEILEASREEIASALEAALKGRQGFFVSFAGNELLKKEAKKLHPFAPGSTDQRRGKRTESFLVLFFKKEHACFLVSEETNPPAPAASRAGRYGRDRRARHR